ncbi:putative glycosidase CRH2 [Microbotryomycetes sp. JL201]|nr:putative glycosidase CRH2 [Microbotryomycetes sp. JL201]
MVVAQDAAPISIRALFPGGPDVKQTIGHTCTIKWEKSPEWNNMEILLMTGSNKDMKEVMRVADGMQVFIGCDASRMDRYDFTCPQVEPGSSIYFYQFNKLSEHDGRTISPASIQKVWTSRFALVGNDQVAEPAEHANQPDGQLIPWGTGRLINGNADALTPETKTSTQEHAEWTSWISSPPTSSPFASAQSAKSSPSPGFSNAPATGLTGFHPNEACSKDQHCPESHPCCSEFGFCGRGRSCLNGCNPLWSFKPNACAPVAACQPQNLTFRPTDNGKIGNGTLWNGDAQSHDWIVSTGKFAPNVTAVAVGNELVLQLKEGANGTSLYSTRSVWYGNVTSRIRSSGERGVVTSLSLISGTRDEIVWEFTGAVDSASTNYFWRGQPVQTASGPQLQDVDVSMPDRSAEYHNFGISWTPETITWSIDGKNVRTVSKKDTFQPDLGLYSYPSTPSRIQLKIFAVDVDAPLALQEWAGGGVDYRSHTYLADGYFASRVKWVNVECFDAVPVSVQGADVASSSVAQPPAPWALSTDDVIRADAPALTDVPRLSLASALTLSLGGQRIETAQPVNGWLAPPAPTNEAAANPHAWMFGGHPLGKLKRDLVSLIGRADQTDSYAYNVFEAIPSAIGINPTAARAGLFSLFPSPTGNAAVSHPAFSALSSAGETSSVAATASSSPTPTLSKGKTVQQGWEDLGTPAHVAIYVGAGLAALASISSGR